MIPPDNFLSKSKTLASLGLITLGLFLAPQSAQAVSLIPLTSVDANPGFDDIDFNLLLDNRDFTELFVAEGRIGNNAIGGDRELGINRDVRATSNPGLAVAQGQYNWGRGILSDFTLAYTGNQVTFSVSRAGITPVVLSTTAFSGDINHIFLRTFAQGGRPIDDNNFLGLSGLSLNGTAIPNISSLGTTSSRDVDYIAIGDVPTNFILTGQAEFDWDGNRPTGSNLAFQIKVGNSRRVPEPSILGAILTTTIAGSFLGYKKKVASQQA
ncbi:choice-of-anchor W domain-containing protein [Anabaena sp. FACHB-709]|uniref:PEP-CTERM protein-sorting domain-containing protein n=2 Tax=Nostocaceae TaxID=1162 RepID=A0A1Z4KM14_ANAVA|nr:MULTISPECIES: choice-of-anchor W domain-containing protein [Nostocaceae]BAY69988.1 hypothetical protein NIES23_27880 [Trichormus variabilis NIES-23]HBW32136.1 hypothetical protein [Nostoc sp. UBA8866]MBD2173556.1 hypothetical protein [Anabaena cylindrica FACHB-318]MBD2265365.1 hypothetical protein [Anabaena sp. FACHB-709]MBD2275683.1 hypothetical protein [Nostoc sp. PCC 7120 = FACHB-418]